MKKKILLFGLLFATLSMSGLTASAQSEPLPENPIAAIQKGHIVNPNPKVVDWFTENEIPDALPHLIWYKYKGLLYSVTAPGAFIPYMWVFKPNGELVDLIFLSTTTNL